MYRANDPTANTAIGNVMREQWKKERSDLHKEQRKKNRNARMQSVQKYRNCPKIYVASPYAGHTASNRAAAIRYCQYVITQGKMPIASHLMYPQILNDGDPQERELGLLFGLSLLSLCDEVWVFGTDVTSGMRREIEEAKRLGKPVRHVGEVDV